MINVFVLQNGRLSQVNIESHSDLEKVQPVWVDLTEPNDQERAWVKSIYGVNFRFMPEFDWSLGYPFTLVLMVCSAITPFWYFRRRGWLN